MMRKKITAVLAGTLFAAVSLIGLAPPSAALSPGVAFSATNLPTWQTNGIVWAMAESKGVVYVGGTFTAIRPPGVDDMIFGQQRVNAPTVFSAEAWFKTDTTSGGKILGFGNAQPRRNNSFLGYSSVYDRHVYMSDAGKLVFGVWTGSRVVVASPASYNDNAWHHVVAAQGAGGMALYVDGVQVAANTVSANTVSLGSWRIGGDSIPSCWPGAPTSRHFKGAIDEFAIYPTALTPAQVAAHNQQGRR